MFRKLIMSHDIESGLGDFGVRKYDDAAGRFLSIDPLWEKYLPWSPYHYCGNNPIMGKDPSGMAIYWMSEDIEEQKYAQQMFDRALKYLEDNGAQKAANNLKELRDNPNFSVGIYAFNEQALNSNNFSSSFNQIFWNPEMAIDVNNAILSPAETLAHEVDHALNANLNKNEYLQLKSVKDAHMKNGEEKRIIQGTEYNTAKQLKHLKDITRPYTRLKHNEGFPIKVLGPEHTK